MPVFNDPILGVVYYSVSREIHVICPRCGNPDCAEIEEFKRRVASQAYDSDVIATPDAYQYFKMQDLEKWPTRILLLEINYLREMFTMESVNQRGKPIEITLRETQEHFEGRQ